MFIEIFTGPNCSYCESAKALMRDNGLAFEEIDLAVSPDNMADFRARLPRTRAIPQIFIDGEHIGGLEDLRLYLAGGRSGHSDMDAGA
jgi:glutaredoxin 3